MSNAIKTAITKIKALNEELEIILISEENLKIRCANVLTTLVNGLTHTIGEDIAESSSSFKPTPITHVLGDDVTQQERIQTKDVKPSDADKDALRNQAIEAYDTFVERDSESILKNVEEIVIRAVAKKAGMDVTSTVPEIITIDFIDQIKEAITLKASVDAAKEEIANSENAEKTNAEIVENYNDLFIESYKNLANEYGRVITDVEISKVKELVQTLVDTGADMNVALNDLQEVTRKQFEDEKGSKEKQQLLIDEMIELSRQLFISEGKEYTAETEADNRRFYTDAPIEELVKVSEGLKADIEKSNATSVETAAKSTKTNPRR